MNMMIVGSVVGNVPSSVGSSTHSVASSLAGSASATVGQPPPAHLTHLTSAPVIGLGQQPTCSSGIPISLRTTVEHSSGSQAPEQHHVLSGSPNSPHFSAVSNNVIGHAVLPSHGHPQTAYMYHGSNTQQQMQQVLTQIPNNSSSLTSSSGNLGGHYSPTSGGATVTPYAHSLPPPCIRQTSNRPVQSSSSGRSMTNGMQARSTPPSRPSSYTGRSLSSNATRSFSSRAAPGGGPTGSSHSPAQHHMHLASQPRELAFPSRTMPMSPQRTNTRQPRPHSGSRPHGYGPSSGGLSSNLPVLGPSQAHQLLAANVNSPSLIPQHVPQGSYLSASLGIHLNAGPSSPQYRVGSPMPLHDNNSIYPPHELKKITKPALGHDEEMDGHHETHHNTARKNLISPRNPQRRTLFNAALQDHNYCAHLPPSPQPPRSPTPPLSPYVSVPAAIMGASAQSQPSSHEHHQIPHQQQDSFSFGIAGYRESSAVLKEASAAAASSGLDKHPHHHSNHHHPSQSLPPGGFPGAASAAATPVTPGTKETGNSMIGGYPSPHYSGQTREAASPLSRLNKAIEDAGVGPMTPLKHEAGDKCTDADESPDSRPSPDRDGGEETETAPEEDASDDAITRCICDFQHDDGYMICCDKCSVWQHVVCMFVDKDNIPDEYLCEKCRPRGVDKKRAKGLQKAREKEIFKTLPIDSSDDERGSAERKLIPVTAAKGRKTSGGAASASSAKKPSFPVGSGLKKGSLVLPEKKVDKKLTKKPVKRRTFKDSLPGGIKVDRKSSPRKNHRRKSASATDIETEEEPPTNDATALRSWIDRYEEAVTNHYSPELRARLLGVKIPSTQFKPKDINSHSARYNVSLRGNGVKVLTANSHIPANTPIIECSGKYMLANQLNSRAQNSEFVLFHRISSELEVCVDCKTYGNDSRFCRRTESDANKFNAEVKHHLDKGSLHLYIVSTRTIDKNQEILLCPLERKVSLPPEPQLSIQDELRQIKKVNGLIEEKKPRKLSNAKQHRRLKREVKKDMCDSSSDEDIPVNVRKTRSKVEKQPAAVSTEKSVNFNLSSTVNMKKEVMKVEAKEEKENKGLRLDDKRKPFSVKPELFEPKLEKIKEPLKIEIKEETYEPEKEEKSCLQQESDPKNPVVTTPRTPCTVAPSTPSGMFCTEAPMTPSSESAADIAAAKSPGKPVLGLPDQTGLIVGVNTINYDVSLRNKSMSREEKKMEMILKAIAAMEKAESRKKHESGSGGEPSAERAPAKRRRSNSSKKEHADSNIESSCDETGLDTRAERPRAPKGKRKRNISMRRRSRAKSGDSTSAMSADESGLTPNIEHESSGTPGDGAPFKFPFKKLQDGDDVDDDVSGHYIRGSRSPPGIANHLLRSAIPHTTPAIKSPTKSIGCSAKKRWLRAAMSEDHAEENSHGGGGCGMVGSLSSPALVPGSSPALVATSPALAAATSPSQEPDYTPLKKRRLATYNESNEEKCRKQDVEQMQEKTSKEQVTEKIKSLPNGLKKRLISNLLLNAVLDKAMEDILPDDYTDGGGFSPIHQQQQSSDEAVTVVADKEAVVASDEPAVLPQDTPSSTPSKKKTRNVRKGTKSKKAEESVEENGVGEEMPRSPQTLHNHAQEDVSEDILPAGTGDNKHESLIKIVTNEVTKSDTELNSNLDKARNAEEKPPTPIQHSVFKSFFSTDLSIDDIDRQIEAKRMELARENSLASSSPSPRLDFSEELPRTLRAGGGGNTPNSKSVANMTPTTARKKVSIADYKRRKQTSVNEENQTDSGSQVGSGITSMLSSKLNTLPPVSLPDLPGLEPVSNKNKNTGSSVFEPKRTRSNSPLYEKRNSSDRKGLTPQESRMRSGSPLDKRSPAKGGRDRTSSPRRGGGSNSYHSMAKKQERWESKSVKDRDSIKGKPSSPVHTSKRVPVPSGVGAAVITDYPPTGAPRPVIHTPDMPREDLTERLRKEFGLTIEDSEGEEEDGSDSEGGGAVSGGGNGSGGVGADYSSLRRHNGPERTNGWREEEKGVGSGAFWTQR